VLDIVIRNATIVTPASVMEGDIGIEGERIAAVAARGVLQSDGARVIDATGQIAVPGGIDPHVHTSWTVPTAAAEEILCADATQVSRAAAYGGTTTLVDFAIWQPGQSLPDAIATKDLDWGGKSYVDYSYHCTFKGEIPFEVIDQIGDVIAAGYPSFKVWMTNATPSRPPQKTDLGYIWAILEQTGRHGGMLAVHAEDDDIVMFSYKRLQHEGRWGYENVHLAHNQLSEAISFRRVINLAERVDAALYLMHVSAEEGVSAIGEARAKGLPIYGETLQHYVSFTSDAYQKPQGAMYHTYPSLKSETDRQALWAGLQTGTLSTIATDEMCTTLAVKLRGKTIDDVTGGHAGVEVRMGIMYTEAVVKRHLSLERFVELTSANAAKILGMYPRKGAIAVGSDADVVLIDPSIRRKLAASELHETDYSIWDQWEVRGWPIMTILRGKVILENGQLLGEPTDGQSVPRKNSPSILARPGC
jgi:dihydropyrimidinase